MRSHSDMPSFAPPLSGVGAVPTQESADGSNMNDVITRHC